MALALYLRFTHAISYRRLSQLFRQCNLLSVNAFEAIHSG
jgi:hypothetical protein